MDSSLPPPSDPAAPAPLSLLEGRVLGCLLEKELSTPDLYPLTLNALILACNQRSNRDPVLAVTASDVEAALAGLRQRRLAVHFAGAEARVPKFKHTFDAAHPIERAARVLVTELLLRGPQTAAALRNNASRLADLPESTPEIEDLLTTLAARPDGGLVRKLPRQPGQKEARWAQLLTGEPTLASEGAGPGGSEPAAPLTIALTLPPEVEARLTALEAEVTHLRTELATLRRALGEG